VIQEFATREPAHAAVRRFTFPAGAAELHGAFDDLPADPYCPGRTRRFSQYVLRSDAVRWSLTRLPHRAHIQPRRFNAHVGGIRRHFAPITIDLSALAARTVGVLELAQDVVYQVDAHQWRTTCEPGDARASVPEGPHHDGHHCGAILVVGRSGIEGGVTEFSRTPQAEPFQRLTLQAGDAVCFDGRAVAHNTTPIRATGAAHGTRDVLIFLFNPWDARRYGAAFERAASA